MSSLSWHIKSWHGMSCHDMSYHVMSWLSWLSWHAVTCYVMIVVTYHDTVKCFCIRSRPQWAGTFLFRFPPTTDMPCHAMSSLVTSWHAILCHVVMVMKWHDTTCHDMSCPDMSWHGMSCHKMSCHDCHQMIRHVMTCHYMSCHDMFWHSTTCHAMSWLSWHIITRYVMTCREMPCHDISMSWRVMSCYRRVITCYAMMVMAYHDTPCHDMSWHVMSWHVMSWHVITCHVMVVVTYHDTMKYFCSRSWPWWAGVIVFRGHGGHQIDGVKGLVLFERVWKAVKML